MTPCTVFVNYYLNWVRTEPRQLRLYFISKNVPTTGNVQFKIPFWPPEESFTGLPAAVTLGKQIQVQGIIIPGENYYGGEHWTWHVQRGGAAETYSEDVIVVAVSVEYSPGRRLFLPFTMK